MKNAACRVEIAGMVQGVGFRPYVCNLARRHGLTGWVYNHAGGVTLQAEGAETALELFLTELPRQLPPLAQIDQLTVQPCRPAGDTEFAIRSSGGGQPTALIVPDAAVCPDCLAEMRDPSDRRYRYPFINCTNCGPRYTIITGIPYDRQNTTMQAFAMCPDCRREYEDPVNRRFHAQPNACPVCGPQCRLLDRQGRQLAVKTDALEQAREWIGRGGILTVKGMGGYHLACDARNPAAVAELRRRKFREDKPFAVMSGSREAVAAVCRLTAQEETLLTATARPIVLLAKGAGYDLAPAVAPDNPDLGVMLPYTPLHWLLLAPEDLWVMTSGNVSDEPIAFGDDDALARLATIADGFLVHDREIYSRADDSVVRIFDEKPYFLRRSRGYAPAPLPLMMNMPAVLALGGELKNTFCLTRGRQAFLSTHNGDLENLPTYEAWRGAMEHYCRLLVIRPEAVAYDPHPRYLTRGYLEGLELPKVAVQHHHAHIAAVLAENGLPGPVIGVAYDGTGYGADGHLWGGEILIADQRDYRRAAHFRYLPLPGGEKAIREPWRLAAWFLQQEYGDDWIDGTWDTARKVRRDADNWRLLLQAAATGLNTPLTSGAGRLFDLTAALLGIRQQVHYEGQAAVELERAAGRRPGQVRPYSLRTDPQKPWELDFWPLLQSLALDCHQKKPVAELAADFHTTLAAATAEVVDRLALETGIREVALGGGVFQNITFLGQVTGRLAAKGFTVYIPRQAPANDGGLALGQAAVAAARLRDGRDG
ncbi:MAG TPA: carbamoyltransferase HypF [Patescibacteria group bacterium]|nr:carbamoyltransferase HypF [Patescibacteria group bacterium]